MKQYNNYTNYSFFIKNIDLIIFKLYFKCFFYLNQILNINSLLNFKIDNKYIWY